MSATPAQPTPAGAGYIRGGGGVEVSGDKVVRLLALVCAVTLMALAIDTAASTANRNSRSARLRNHGVPVQVTVSGCLGISSGIAQAIQYYQCRGTYAVGGRTYNEVVGGVRSPLPVGHTLQAEAARDDPALVSTAAGAATEGSYTLSIVLGLLALGLIIGLTVWSRRRSGPLS